MKPWRPLSVGLACGLFAGSFGLSSASTQEFPAPRPTTRAEAVELICANSADRGACVRARLREIGRTPAPPAVLRAVELLSRGIDYASVREVEVDGGVSIRYTMDVGAFDRVRTDHPSSGAIPETIEATAVGLTRARDLLIGDLELPDPGVDEVLMVELGYRVDGYPLRSARGRSALVLDATPSGGRAAALRSAIRQYAFATASGVGPALSSGWAEAFAEWAVLSLEGADDVSLTRISERLRRMDEGLLSEDPRLASGNAVWFAFLEELFGRTAVRVTLEELSRPQPTPIALDRAMRRISNQDLASALREFHVWTVLTGSRADGHHLPFAARLEFPGFAATAEGLPALSVHREPAVAPLGATQIRLQPGLSQGGLRLRFEGEFAVRWEVDLLLISERGTIHRFPLPLSTEGRGEITVPLDDVQEALLLVRNLEGSDGTPQRYTYSAHHDRSFPFEMTELDVSRRAVRTGGVIVSWSTSAEQDLVGFNILRRQAEGTPETAVNPVWIPALGLIGDEITSYQFVDREAEPDTAYHYRIQAITTSGLSSYSDPFYVPAATPRR